MGLHLNEDFVFLKMGRFTKLKRSAITDIFQFYNLTSHFKLTGLVAPIHLLSDYIFKQAYRTMRDKFNIEMEYDDENPETYWLKLEDNEVYLNPYLQVLFMYKEIVKIISNIEIKMLYDGEYYIKQVRHSRKLIEELNEDLKFILKYNGEIRLSTQDEEGNLIETSKFEDQELKIDDFDLIGLERVAKSLGVEIDRVEGVEFNMDPEHHLFEKFKQKVVRCFHNIQKYQYKMTEDVLEDLYGVIRTLLLKRYEKTKGKDYELIKYVVDIDKLNKLEYEKINLDDDNNYELMLIDVQKNEIYANFKMINYKIKVNSKLSEIRKVNLKNVLETVDRNYGCIYNFNPMVAESGISYDYRTQFFDFIYDYRLYKNIFKK